MTKEGTVELWKNKRTGQFSIIHWNGQSIRFPVSLNSYSHFTVLISIDDNHWCWIHSDFNDIRIRIIELQWFPPKDFAEKMSQALNPVSTSLDLGPVEYLWEQEINILSRTFPSFTCMSQYLNTLMEPLNNYHHRLLCKSFQNCSALNISILLLFLLPLNHLLMIIPLVVLSPGG